MSLKLPELKMVWLNVAAVLPQFVWQDSQKRFGHVKRELDMKSLMLLVFMGLFFGAFLATCTNGMAGF